MLEFSKKYWGYYVLTAMLIALVVILCIINSFNPFIWIAHHWKIVGSIVLVVVAIGLAILSLWLHYRKRY